MFKGFKSTKSTITALRIISEPRNSVHYTHICQHSIKPLVEYFCTKSQFAIFTFLVALYSVKGDSTFRNVCLCVCVCVLRPFLERFGEKKMNKSAVDTLNNDGSGHVYFRRWEPLLNNNILRGEQNLWEDRD